VKLSVSADAASPTTPGRNDGYVDIVFLGRISVSCPHEVKCSPSPDGDLTEIAVPINIQENGDSIAETVTIHDLRFGAASNGVSAIAQFPTVLLGKNTAGTAPTLDISYSLRDADNYDWSVPPAEYLEGNSYVDWTEQLGGGSVSEVQPMVITGTNEGAQARDDRNTFISGVLLGVAGSAAIAFAQEGLHMLFDNRDDNRPRGSGGGRKANR
jgi:hypothetical protein